MFSMFNPKPKIAEIILSKQYQFMYENFVVATQRGVLLVLEKHDNLVSFLQFDSSKIKYGSPNDEARGGHPLSKFGLGWYGLFEVMNSPWVREQMIANRVHARHTDGMYDGVKHYIACFKDVTFEVMCRSFQERHVPLPEFLLLINRQLDDLTVDS